MTASLGQTVLSPWLTPVRLVSIANIAGTYNNGPSNNGVGATLTVAASSLTIDSVLCEVGDRVLLQTQTNAYEQGIYIVKSIGSTVVLERSADMQEREQMKAGFYVSVGAGSLRAGNFYSLIEPLPNVIGVDAVIWNAEAAGGAVSFSGAASTANAIPVFSDTAGNIKAANAAPVTLGQNLAVTGTGLFSGALSSTAGPITSGSSGDAGSFISFPATAANGTFIFEALNAGGAFNTTLRNSIMGQSTVLSFPDPGAATANVLLDTGTNTSGSFTEITIANTGLHILDTNATHDLIIAPGSDLTADRTLTLTTGDASRTLSILAGVALDQNLQIADSPTFAAVTLGNSGLHVLDTNASHDLVITPGSDLTADRILTLTTGDAARTLDISAASVTVSAYGATLVDDAANLNALTTLGIRRGDSDTWGGGGTSFAFTCAGIVATDVVVVSLIAAANNVAVTKCVAGAGTITVDFTADPGAGTIVNFIGLPTV